MGYFHPSCNTDQGVKQTRKGEDEQRKRFSRTERVGLVPRGVHLQHGSTPTGPHVGLSLSVPVWTRKVVNYA